MAEQTIKSSWVKLPIMIRIQLMMQLARIALDHEDAVKASDLVNQTHDIFQAYQWPLEDRIPVMAQLAGLRHRAGETDKARSELDAAHALFNQERASIINIFRPETLRPVAEAYQAMGDAAAALSAYKQAVEEGIENPNSTPRAEDLSATCCSMALHSVEPDTELWTRLRQIREGFGQPW